MIVVTVLLLLPATEIPEIDLFGYLTDKVIHAGVYGLVVLLFGWPAPQYLTRTVILSIVHGIAMEFGQKYLTVNRSFDVWDMVADAAGCLLAMALVKGLKKNKPL